MALTKKVKTEIKNMISKYNKYFDLLANSGGALYIKEISILTNTNYNTLCSHLKIIEESGLELINIYYNSDNRKVIALTRRAWGQMNINRHESMCKKTDLQSNLYKAYDYIKFKNLRELDKQNKEFIISEIKDARNITTLFNYKWLEILNSNKFLITNIDNTEKIKIKIIYYTKNIYTKELINFMHTFYRIISYIYFDKDFKIDLDVITLNNVNIPHTLHLVKSSKSKIDMYLKNKQHGTKKFREIFEKYYKNKIDFYQINKDLEIIKI